MANEPMNKWEKLFESWLEHNQFLIEENLNPDPEYEGSYLVVDREQCWGNEVVRTAEDVLSAHPSTEMEFLDSMEEEAEGLALPERVVKHYKDGSYEEFFPMEAGYWAVIYERKDDLFTSEDFKKFFEENDWGLQICELLAFHLEEVDLSKFI